MTIDDKIIDKKMQHDINTEAALSSEISAFSSGKNYKYEYLAGEEILSSNQRQIIENGKNKQKKVDAIKSIDLFNKKDELKQIEGIFPQHLMNDLIRAKLKRNR